MIKKLEEKTKKQTKKKENLKESNIMDELLPWSRYYQKKYGKTLREVLKNWRNSNRIQSRQIQARNHWNEVNQKIVDAFHILLNGLNHNNPIRRDILQRLWETVM